MFGLTILWAVEFSTLCLLVNISTTHKFSCAHYILRVSSLTFISKYFSYPLSTFCSQYFQLIYGNTFWSQPPTDYTLCCQFFKECFHNTEKKLLIQSNFIKLYYKNGYSELSQSYATHINSKFQFVSSLYFIS